MKLFLTILSSVSLFAGEYLTWDAPPVEEQVEQFNVYWSTNRSGPWTLVWIGFQLAGRGSTNTVGVNYYRYTKVNRFGESDPSEVMWRPSKPSGGKVHTQ